jgi:hypothetical protein
MKFEVTFIDKNEKGEKFWNTVICEAENKKRQTIWSAMKEQHNVKGIDVESWKEITD